MTSFHGIHEQMSFNVNQWTEEFANMINMGKQSFVKVELPLGKGALTS